MTLADEQVLLIHALAHRVPYVGFVCQIERRVQHQHETNVFKICAPKLYG